MAHLNSTDANRLHKRLEILLEGLSFTSKNSAELTRQWKENQLEQDEYDHLIDEEYKLLTGFYKQATDLLESNSDFLTNYAVCIDNPFIALMLALPTRDPRNNVNWSAWNGDIKITFKSRKYIDKQGDEAISGIPFGPFTRILLLYILNEVHSKNSAHIDIGSDLAFLIKEMSFSDGGRSYGLAKNIKRLFECEITLQNNIPAILEMSRLSEQYANNSDECGNIDKALRKHTGQFFPKTLGKYTDDNDRYTIDLDKDFFNILKATQLPVRFSDISPLRSTYQLDIYIASAYFFSFVEPGTPIHRSWEDLHRLNGKSIQQKKKFVESWRISLKEMTPKFPPVKYIDYEDSKNISFKYSKTLLKYFDIY